MNTWDKTPPIASIEEATEQAAVLEGIDQDRMLNAVLQMPEHIHAAFKTSLKYHEGDIPLDRSKLYLLGMGGSAIAGDLINDMLAPSRKLTLFRGNSPPRDRRGAVISSYSGNTREVIELVPNATGGLKSAICLTSGGDLARLGWDLALPVWKMPGGYQPRAAVGWSIGLLMSAMVKWRIVQPSVQESLKSAALKLSESVKRQAYSSHPLIRATLPIAKALVGKNVIVFYTASCTGAALRLTAQLNENAKHPACAILMPEGLHNSIEGILGTDPESTAMIFLSDPEDSDFLRKSLAVAADFLTKRNFACMFFPAAGNDKYELTLSRILISDFVSLFLAALKGVDPTPLPTISVFKTLLYT